MKALFAGTPSKKNYSFSADVTFLQRSIVPEWLVLRCCASVAFRSSGNLGSFCQMITHNCSIDIYTHNLSLINALNSTGTEIVSVAIHAALPEECYPGGTLGVMVKRGTPHQSLVIPQSAVLLDQAGRAAATGFEQDRDVVVSNGLKEGELVIVEGIQKVRPGQSVSASVTSEN